MDDFELDSMEAALSRAAERHAPPPLDPRSVRRRLVILQAGPWLWLLFVAAIAGTAAVQSAWWIAALAGVVLLPGAIAGVRVRRDELAALATADDLAAIERRHFTALANSQRSAVIVEAAIALLLAAIAWHTGDAWRWGVAAFFGALAAGRLVAVVPFVERANRDAGGEAPPRWITLLVLFALFVLLPFLLLGKLVVAGWRAVGRRLGGRS